MSLMESSDQSLQSGFFTRSRYFFLGLIVGQAGISGLFLVIDYITGVVGNSLFFM